MKSYAGNPSNYPADTKLIDDGDDANATTMSAVLKPIADRTAYLKAFKDSVESAGVTRIRTAASFAAIEAMTGMAEGDLVLLPAYGLYRYEPLAKPDTMPCGLPWVVKPTGAIGGWMSAALLLSDAALPVGAAAAGRAVTLDSAGKVPKARTYQPAYEVVGIYDVETVGSEQVSASGYFDSSDSAVDTGALLAGDRIQAHWAGRIGTVQETDTWQAALRVTRGAATVNDTLFVTGVGVQGITLIAPRTAVLSAGAHRVHLVCRSISGSAPWIDGGSTLSVTVFRATM